MITTIDQYNNNGILPATPQPTIEEQTWGEQACFVFIIKNDKDVIQSEYGLAACTNNVAVKALEWLTHYKSIFLIFQIYCFAIVSGISIFVIMSQSRDRMISGLAYLKL